MNFASTPYSPTNSQVQYGRPQQRLILPCVNYFPIDIISFDSVEKDEVYSFLDWLEYNTITLALNSYFYNDGFICGDTYLIGGVTIMDNLIEHFYVSVEPEVETRADAFNQGCLFEWLFIHEVNNGSEEFYKYCISLEKTAYDLVKHLDCHISQNTEGVVQFVYVEKLSDGSGYIVYLEY